MIEQISTITITLGSALLFVYWFRYSCSLILNARTARDFAADVVSANRLAFLNVQTQLQQGVADLGALQASLDRDYAVLQALMKDAAGLEDRVLQVNYRVMSAWCNFSARFSPNSARKALGEMSMVIAYFANAVGERASCGAAA